LETHSANKTEIAINDIQESTINRKPSLKTNQQTEVYGPIVVRSTYRSSLYDSRYPTISFTYEQYMEAISKFDKWISSRNETWGRDYFEKVNARDSELLSVLHILITHPNSLHRCQLFCAHVGFFQREESLPYLLEAFNQQLKRKRKYSIVFLKREHIYDSIKDILGNKTPEKRTLVKHLTDRLKRDKRFINICHEYLELVKYH
jgi:hypothetical protein